MGTVPKRAEVGARNGGKKATRSFHGAGGGQGMTHVEVHTPSRQRPPCQRVRGATLSLLSPVTVPPRAWLAIHLGWLLSHRAPWCGSGSRVTFSFSGQFLWDVKLALGHAREGCPRGGSTALGLGAPGPSLGAPLTHAPLQARRALAAETPGSEGEAKEKNAAPQAKKAGGRGAQGLLFANSGNPERC